MPKATGFIAALVVLIGMSPLWADNLPGRITVTGEGRVSALPDMALVTMGATAEAETAKSAMDETSVVTNAILERLADAGVAERDVQTSDLRLMPVWSNRTTSDTRPKIDGYQASNRVTVRVRDLTSLGSILDAVLMDGANQLGGLQFMVSDPEPLLNEARLQAVAAARARAELFAEAAGVTLGPLVSLSEAGGQMPRPEMLGLARASDAGMPIAQGEAELSANVTLVYQIGAE